MQAQRDLMIPACVKQGTTSIPLILPNDREYNSESNSTRVVQGAERSHLVVVPEALEVLKKVTSPIAVLSITGLARSGKSYILSRLLGTTDAFSLGHTMEPETFGIWLGTKALEKDGLTVLLIDTEGIDAFASQKKDDVTLLVMTLLMSSLFIFNTISVPKQGQLEDLQCFVQIATSVRVKESGERDYSELAKVFPDFLWLLRDSHLVPTDARGQPTDPKTYLVDRVLASSGGFAETKSDLVGRAIRTFFPSLDCVCLPPPTQDPNVLANLEHSTGKLTPEFNDGVAELLTRLWGMIRPKLSFDTGRPITGTQMAVLVEQYVRALNEPGAVPVIESSLKMSVKVVTDRALAESVEVYKQGMTQAMNSAEAPLEEGDPTVEEGSNTMHGLHKLHFRQAEKVLRDVISPLGGEVAVNKALLPFKANVFGEGTIENGLFFKFLQENYRWSSQYNQDLISNLYQKIEECLATEEYTYEQLKQDLAVHEEKYKSKAAGPAQSEVFKEFLMRKEPDWNTLAKKEKYDEARDIEDRRAKQMHAELQMLNEETERVQGAIADQMMHQESELVRLQEEYETSVRHMQEQERAAAEADMQEQLKQMNEQYKGAMESLQQQSQRTAELLFQQVQQMQQNQAQQQSQMMDMVQKIQQRNEAIAQETAAAAAAAESSTGSPGQDILGFFSNALDVVYKGISVAGFGKKIFGKKGAKFAAKAAAKSVAKSAVKP